MGKDHSISIKLQTTEPENESIYRIHVGPQPGEKESRAANRVWPAANNTEPGARAAGWNRVVIKRGQERRRDDSKGKWAGPSDGPWLNGL